MEKFKGTKGKWEVSIAFEGETENIHIKSSGNLLTVEDFNGKAVAIIGRIGEEEQEANARIIASAPLLLSDLNDLVWLIEKGATQEELEERIKTSKQLISKITE